MSIFINFLLAIHIIVSLLIVLLVLMQRPKNEGLGAAFGGGMTENLFGAQTTNVLQTVTRWLGAIFFSLSLLLSWLYVKQTTSHSTLQQRLSAPTVIPPTPAPVIPKDVPTSLPEAATQPMKPEGASKATPMPAPKPAEPQPSAETKPEAPKPEAPKAEMPKPAEPAKPVEPAKPAAATPAPPPASTPATPAPAPASTPAAPAPAPAPAAPGTPEASKSAPSPAIEKAPEAPKQ